MKAYYEMYSWIRRVVDNNDVKAIDRNPDTPPTYSDITLSILSSQNNQTKRVVYHECLPVSLGDISFESTGTGTEFVTFTVAFRFTYFEFI